MIEYQTGVGTLHLAVSFVLRRVKNHFQPTRNRIKALARIRTGITPISHQPNDSVDHKDAFLKAIIFTRDQTPGLHVGIITVTSARWAPTIVISRVMGPL